MSNESPENNSGGPKSNLEDSSLALDPLSLDSPSSATAAIRASAVQSVRNFN